MSKVRIALCVGLAYALLSLNWLYFLIVQNESIKNWHWSIQAVAIVAWLVLVIGSTLFFYNRVLRDYGSGVDARYQEYVAHDQVKNRSTGELSENHTPAEMPAFAPRT
ncbi:MAG: hypothetical protein ABL921_13395 [Pirellula sp.]